MFAEIILGHLVGDYMLQSKAMALKKSEKGFHGILWCTFHSLVYTVSVCLFLWTVDPLVVILVFMSHWPLDRWSLASKWLKLIKGRSLVGAFNSTDKYREFDIAFSALVYTVVDNTMHILLIWLIVKTLM